MKKPMSKQTHTDTWLQNTDTLGYQNATTADQGTSLTQEQLNESYAMGTVDGVDTGDES
ncbi:hypothetical protein [Brevibacillus daliensis]|uniref:hypothetical protein n=1 Tax=Brevibacillus daliensis TaxID=2892995 RepID=UPI001E5A00EB|nr:hypothetical protein [Brevibacillus daliensis]